MTTVAGPEISRSYLKAKEIFRIVPNKEHLNVMITCRFVVPGLAGVCRRSTLSTPVCKEEPVATLSESTWPLLSTDPSWTIKITSLESRAGRLETRSDT